MTAAETYAQLFKLAATSSEVQEIKKLAQGGFVRILRHPATLLGLGALGAAVPTALIARSQSGSTAEAARLQDRNLALGAGLALGLAAPPLLKALSKATGLGLTHSTGNEMDERFMSI